MGAPATRTAPTLSDYAAFLPTYRKDPHGERLEGAVDPFAGVPHLLAHVGSADRVNVPLLIERFQPQRVVAVLGRDAQLRSAAVAGLSCAWQRGGDGGRHDDDLTHLAARLT